MKTTSSLFAMSLRAAIIASALVLTSTASAADLTLGFDGITTNNVADVATGETQLSVIVSDPGANQVKFTFNNAGPDASSIADVYFDDGIPIGGATLLGIATITNGSGVDFSQGASPGNLPGGADFSPSFQATAGFTADSNPPAQPNGVNPGESLSILFNLQNGKTFADVVTALQVGGDRGLRIGIHVQGFEGGGSESFINTTPVPEPEIYAMLVAGLGLMGFVARRRKQQLAA